MNLVSDSSNDSIETGEKNKYKPEILCYYNKTKAGVDLLDIKCAIDSSNRKNRRWPLAIFYQMLDIGRVIAFILYASF